MTDYVECHSESSYAERPVALTVNGQRLEILKILSTWRSPNEIHFYIETTDKHMFELVYKETTDTWYIQEL